mmetsp:Transcript_8692/g.22694  ORF Transcript_8692/g.22694 Transcript_8692/m.22694 type:complete len:273 (+) Transcript_8692:469-1287(+)
MQHRPNHVAQTRRERSARAIIRRRLSPAEVWSLEDVDVLAHLAALVLCDALGDPDDVADLLLLELHKGIVHPVVELLLEGEAVEVDFELEELILERLVLLHAVLREQRAIVGVGVDRRTHRVEVGRSREARRALRVEETDGGVERLARLEVKRGDVDRVDGDIDRATVCLEEEDVAHHLACRATNALAEGVEVLEVRLVQRITDDLNVHLAEVIERYAVAKVGAERGVHEHHPIQLLGVGRHRRGHQRIKQAKRVQLARHVLNVTVVLHARQ